MQATVKHKAVRSWSFSWGQPDPWSGLSYAEKHCESWVSWKTLPVSYCQDTERIHLRRNISFWRRWSLELALSCKRFLPLLENSLPFTHLSAVFCFLLTPGSYCTSLLFHPIRIIKMFMRMDVLFYDERLEKIGLNYDASHLLSDWKDSLGRWNWYKMDLFI